MTASAVLPATTIMSSFPHQTAAVTSQVRERQWMYLGPIAAAPLAHIAVTLYRDAKTVRQKQFIIGVGIIGSTVMTVGMRVCLMYHAGYPGKEAVGVLDESRIRHVTPKQRQEIENPSLGHILIKQIFRGFG